MEGSSRSSGKSCVQCLKECSQTNKKQEGLKKIRNLIVSIGTRLSLCLVDIMLLMSQGSDEMIEKFQEFSCKIYALQTKVDWDGCAINERVTSLLGIADRELEKINMKRMQAMGGRLATMEGYNYGTELFECFCIITLDEGLERLLSAVISRMEFVLSIPFSPESLTWMLTRPPILDEMETKISECIRAFIDFVVDAEPVVNEFRNTMQPKINQLWKNFGHLKKNESAKD
ncbi:hypothetical protein COP2_007444 [Malus domestica]